jgi:hypothetical protein
MKSLVHLFADKETNRSYTFANGLNRLAIYAQHYHYPLLWYMYFTYLGYLSVLWSQSARS